MRCWGHTAHPPIHPPAPTPPVAGAHAHTHPRPPALAEPPPQPACPPHAAWVIGSRRLLLLQLLSRPMQGVLAGLGLQVCGGGGGGPERAAFSNGLGAGAASLMPRVPVPRTPPPPTPSTHRCWLKICTGCGGCCCCPWYCEAGRGGWGRCHRRAVCSCRGGDGTPSARPASGVPHAPLPPTPCPHTTHLNTNRSAWRVCAAECAAFPDTAADYQLVCVCVGGGAGVFS